MGVQDEIWVMGQPAPLESQVESTILTFEEQDALDLSGKLAGALKRLLDDAVQQPNGDESQAAYDWAELAHHIHVLQRYVMSNALARQLPDELRGLGKRIGG